MRETNAHEDININGDIATMHRTIEEVMINLNNQTVSNLQHGNNTSIMQSERHKGPHLKYGEITNIKIQKVTSELEQEHERKQTSQHSNNS